MGHQARIDQQVILPPLCDLLTIPTHLMPGDMDHRATPATKVIDRGCGMNLPFAVCTVWPANVGKKDITVFTSIT